MQRSEDSTLTSQIYDSTFFLSLSLFFFKSADQGDVCVCMCVYMCVYMYI